MSNLGSYSSEELHKKMKEVFKNLGDEAYKLTITLEDYTSTMKEIEEEKERNAWYNNRDLIVVDTIDIIDDDFYADDQVDCAEEILEDNSIFDEDGEFIDIQELQCLSCYNRKRCGICRFPERSCEDNEGDCWDYCACNSGGDNFEDSNY